MFGRDITDSNLPQEVGRDALAISFVKGCYLGQETVARIDARDTSTRCSAACALTEARFPRRGPAIGRRPDRGPRDVGGILTRIDGARRVGLRAAAATTRRAVDSKCPAERPK